jgi:predicted nucleic acid-binding Zn ribbon protein
LETLEKGAADRAQPASVLMPRVLQSLRIDKRRSETEILKVWNHLIDPTVTAHAQPTGIHKGTLFVGVDSDVWRAEILRYRRAEILDRLQHAFGRDLIRRISFRVG